MKAFSVFSDVFRIVLSDRKSLMWHAGILLLGPVALVLTWPDQSLSQFLAAGDGPEVFRAAVIACGIGLFVSAGGWSFGSVHGAQPHSFLRWYRYAEVEPVSYLLGRVLFHAAHTGLLVVLIFPSLMVAAASSLVPPGVAVRSAVLVFWFTLTLRCAAEGGRRTDGKAGSIGISAYVVVLMPYLVLTASTLPEWSVLHALRFPDGPVVWKAAALHAVMAALGLGIAALRTFSETSQRTAS